MLILTRKPGQKFYIGHDISVTIFSIKGNQIRIGVHAPKDVPVHREEVYNKIYPANLDIELRRELSLASPKPGAHTL